MNQALLNKVRERVLIIRALQDDPRYGAGFALSRFCFYFPDENRGHIQRCLSLLAKEGIMYERSHTEGHVAPYSHSETDKNFRIRVTRDEAIAKLKEMNVEWEHLKRNPIEDRNKYEHRTLFNLP